MAEPPAAASEWTIGKLMAWTQEHLKGRGLDEPRLCAELLLAHALGLRRIDLYARFADVPPDEPRNRFRQLVQAAATHRPIAYLIGRKEFYSLEFEVTPAVLIPRPETELLVERALIAAEAIADRDPVELLDLGTGSGCIAISIAKRRPNLRATAADKSPAALEVAMRNASRHAVADRIRFVCADYLSLPAGLIPAGGFDLVVSNPPYVAERDRDQLPANVRDHEPAEALFAGPDGFSAYQAIARDIGAVLRPGGTLLLEVGQGQAEAVDALMTAAGLQPIGRHRDLRGLERAMEYRRLP